MYLEIYMIEAKILVLRRSTLHLADQQIRKKHFAKNSIHRTQFNTYILIFPIFASGIRESFACIQYTHTHTGNNRTGRKPIDRNQQPFVTLVVESDLYIRE